MPRTLVLQKLGLVRSRLLHLPFSMIHVAANFTSKLLLGNRKCTRAIIPDHFALYPGKHELEYVLGLT